MPWHTHTHAPQTYVHSHKLCCVHYGKVLDTDFMYPSWIFGIEILKLFQHRNIDIHLGEITPTLWNFFDSSWESI